MSSRSAYGLDSAPLVNGWQEDAACRVDAELWFAPDAATRAVARHICVRHCPVAEECFAATMAEVRRGVRPVGEVRAGAIWNDGGRLMPKMRQSIARRCYRCRTRVMSVDDAVRAERDILAYACLKDASGPLLEKEHYRETLLLLAAGATDAQMARDLHCSLHGIKSRVKVILRELKARDRHHAVALARQQGLVGLGAP